MLSSSDVAIIGAGPYGLSIAAHLRAKGVDYRIVGDPMEFWREHMPRGMLLKSDGFASMLSDPQSHLTLRRYCEERDIQYADLGTPVRLEDFCGYGLAFQQRFVPNLNNKKVTLVEETRAGFTLHLSDGESFIAQRVVIATGLSHFDHVPAQLTPLHKDLWSHSSAHAHPDQFKGRDVTVIGGGASATELATLLHEAHATVRIVTRQPSLSLHSRDASSRTLAQRIRRPTSPIGPGWKSRFFTDLPHMFYHLPKPVRDRLVKGFLGPAGGWFLRGRLEHVPVLAGYQIKGAEAAGRRAILWLRSSVGEERRIETEHVIAATGYRADIHRLPFLSASLTAGLKSFDNVPRLSSHFESTVPGLFFVGAVAAGSFGPLLRFACGTVFTASRLSNHLARTSRSTKRRAAAVAF
jgi:thioredoxin reductase